MEKYSIHLKYKGNHFRIEMTSISSTGKFCACFKQNSCITNKEMAARLDLSVIPIVEHTLPEFQA